MSLPQTCGQQPVDTLRYFDNNGNMETQQAVAALTALAQESRLAIFRLLVRAGEEGVPAGQIAEELSLPAATTSFHLKELTHAGLIASSREGRSLIYSIQSGTINQLLAFLVQDCCQGRPELCQLDSLQPAKKKSRSSNRC